jgi:hypothetical protein
MCVILLTADLVLQREQRACGECDVCVRRRGHGGFEHAEWHVFDCVNVLAGACVVQCSVCVDWGFCVVFRGCVFPERENRVIPEEISFGVCVSFWGLFLIPLVVCLCGRLRWWRCVRWLSARTHTRSACRWTRQQVCYVMW